METATEPPLTVLDKALEYRGARPYIPAGDAPADPRRPPPRAKPGLLEGDQLREVRRTNRPLLPAPCR